MRDTLIVTSLESSAQQEFGTGTARFPSLGHLYRATIAFAQAKLQYLRTETMIRDNQNNVS